MLLVEEGNARRSFDGKHRDATSLTPGQRRCFDAVRANPGISIREFARLADIAHSTATFHLSTLVRLKLVSQRRMGRDLRHFPVRFETFPVLVKAMAAGPRRPVLLLLRKEGECRWTINGLASEAGVHFGLAKRTIDDLTVLGLIRIERARYRYRVHVTAELARLLRAGLG